MTRRHVQEERAFDALLVWQNTHRGGDIFQSSLRSWLYKWDSHPIQCLYASGEWWAKWKVKKMIWTNCSTNYVEPSYQFSSWLTYVCIHGHLFFVLLRSMWCIFFLGIKCISVDCTPGLLLLLLAHLARAASCTGFPDLSSNHHSFSPLCTTTLLQLMAYWRRRRERRHETEGQTWSMLGQSGCEWATAL